MDNFALGAGMTIPYWDFMGSTMVTSNYIRLTPDQQSKQGILWNTVVSGKLFLIIIWFYGKTSLLYKFIYVSSN